MPLPRHRPRAQERGAALILAILVTFILTILGLSLLFTTSTEFQIAGAETTVNRTFYAADSGTQYGNYQIKSLRTVPDSYQACASPTNYFCFQVPARSTAATDHALTVQVTPLQLVNISQSTPGGGSLNINAIPIMILDYQFTSTATDSTAGIDSTKSIQVVSSVGPIAGSPLPQ
jgi:Tfp pilus assembly protein PilX